MEAPQRLARSTTSSRGEASREESSWEESSREESSREESSREDFVLRASLCGGSKQKWSQNDPKLNARS